MLQVTLDPSLLTSLEETTGEQEFDLSLTITGVYWKSCQPAASALPLGCVPAEWIESKKGSKVSDEIQDILYPWNWKFPENIRIYWIKEIHSEGKLSYDFVMENGKPSYEEINISAPIIKESYKNDLVDNFKVYLKHLFGNKLWPEIDGKPGLFNPHEIFWDGSQHVEYHDKDNLVKEVNTGFLKSAVGNFSQKLPPLNQYSSLVFLNSSKVIVPEESTHFVSFPSSHNKEEYWWRIYNEDPNIKFSQDRNQCELIYVPELLGHIDVPADEKRLIASCTVTPLKYPNNDDKVPIQLRDKEGEFLGIVNLHIKDIENQIPSIVFTSGHFFDLPQLFWNYLSKNKSRLYFNNTNVTEFESYKKLIKKINDFLWAVIRDSLGLGYLIESDDNSIVQRIVRQYCNETIGEVQNLEGSEQILYWEEYNRIKETLNSKLRTWNLFFGEYNEPDNLGLERWKDLITKKVFANEDLLKSTEYLPVKPALLKDEIKVIVMTLEPNFNEISLPYRRPEPPVQFAGESLDTIKSTIDKWLSNWSVFLSTLSGTSTLQSRILFAQWFSLDLKSAGLVELDKRVKLEPQDSDGKKLIKYLLWFENVFTNGGEMQELQKEAIAVIKKDNITKSIKKSLDASATEIKNDILEALKSYSDDRIATPGPDPLQTIFYPLVQDPFANPPVGMQAPPNWNEFLNSIRDDDGEIETAVAKEINITFNVPPNIQIKVDTFENTLPKDDLDDLNNEISGHIVLTRRANSLNKNDYSDKAWRYLNWAKVQAIADQSYKFKNSYISPVFLPEASGNKNSFLELSNEKLSLIAGHTTNNDEPGKDELKPLGYLQYSFDEEHQSYAFWYGYQYKFAGFVALNSGVLPELIRAKPDVWNIPLKTETTLKQRQFPHEAPYFHLRRVPVSKVRVEAKRVDVKNHDQITELSPIPKGFLALAFELPEWKANVLADPKISNLTSNEIEAIKQNDQNHYLLAEGNTGEFDQKKIQLTLKKPTTSYWNWYAWLGDDANITTDQKFPDKTDLTGKNHLTDQMGYMLDEAAGKYYRVDDNGQRIKHESGNDIESDPFKRIKHIGLEKDLRSREDYKGNNSLKREDYLIDTAIENTYIITLEKLFPEKKFINWGLVSIPSPQNPEELILFKSGLKDTSSFLNIRTDKAEATEMKFSAGKEIKELIIQYGEVVRLKVHCLVKKSCFGEEETGYQRFHNFMKNVVLSNANIDYDELRSYLTSEKKFLTKPQELWIESAVKANLSAKPKEPLLIRRELTSTLPTQGQLNEQLWKNLKPRSEIDKTIASIDKNKDEFYIDFAYTSRTEIKHQVWNWNGRLDESDLLTEADLLDPVGPENKTTSAMKWEAWAFSDRPDFSALVHETNLLAFRYPVPATEPIIPQDVFTDLRPGEQKALYYRFSAILHSRYELLGDSFKFSIVSEIPVKDNPSDKPVSNKWRRHLRKCTKTKPLPKPSIRFVIPLTKSIEQCKEEQNITSASLLVVLDDRWFTEAGLAEQFELGIEVLNNPGDEKGSYLNAGNDPILTGTSLGPVKTDFSREDSTSYPYVIIQDLPGEAQEGEEKRKKRIAVFEAKGPVGLTFDFSAQTPRLKGCAFIVEVPKIDDLIPAANGQMTNKLQPWSLIQISVRRALREMLCEDGVAVEALSSEWTAKEWVQFLPSVDSFIPNSWRKKVMIENGIILKLAVDERKISFEPDNNLPEFDSVFEERMERFLVVTEKVYDIGGQPCERYIATYKYDPLNKEFNIDPPGSLEKPFFKDGNKVKEGFVRLLLIRSIKGNHIESIWHRLFGENASDRPDLTRVQEDPTAALPLVSERIPYKIK